MLQTGEQRAIFSKQGITISIPKDALPEGIQNEDQIEVIIQKDTDGGFSFSFSINGTVLNSLPDVSVMLPYPNDPAAGTLFLCDESGMEVPMTGYDDTAKAASFQISHGKGRYRFPGTCCRHRAQLVAHILFDSGLSASSVCRCVFPKEEAKIRWYLLW